MENFPRFQLRVRLEKNVAKNASELKIVDKLIRAVIDSTKSIHKVFAKLHLNCDRKEYKIYLGLAFLNTPFLLDNRYVWVTFEVGGAIYSTFNYDYCVIRRVSIFYFSTFDIFPTELRILILKCFLKLPIYNGL